MQRQKKKPRPNNAAGSSSSFDAQAFRPKIPIGLDLGTTCTSVRYTFVYDSLGYAELYLADKYHGGFCLTKWPMSGLDSNFVPAHSLYILPNQLSIAKEGINFGFDIKRAKAAIK